MTENPTGKTTGKMTGADPERQEIWELIPWYVNGTLDGEERARVEAYAATSEQCAAEIRAQRRLATSLEDIAVLDAAAERGWSSLKSRISAEEAPPPKPRRFNLDWIRWPSFPIALSVPAGVAVAVVLALVWSGGELQQGPAEFRTLTSGEAHDGPVIRAQLTADGSADALAAAAERLGLALISGPSAGGVYTLAPSSEADLEK
ncbi:MAG: zf-HC2 domain-containing protein, partial [Pseudomonadota bacterium]